MNNNNKKDLFPFIIFIICVAGLVFVIKSNSIDIGLFNWKYLGIYIIITVSYQFLAAARTSIILGLKQYIKSFYIQAAAIVTGSPTPIKLGIPLKIYLFKKYLNIPIIETTSAILYESLIRIIVLLLLGLSFSGWQYFNKINQIIYFFIPLLFISPIIIMLLFRNIKGGLIDRIKLKLSELIDVFKHMISSWDLTVKILIIQIIIQLAFILRIKLLLNGIGDESLTLLEISRAIIITGLITTLSMIPGGYGIKEISLIYLLQLEGLDYSNSIFISLADRSLQIGISMILGIFASIYFSKFNTKNVRLKNVWYHR